MKFILYLLLHILGKFNTSTTSVDHAQYVPAYVLSEYKSLNDTDLNNKHTHSWKDYKSYHLINITLIVFAVLNTIFSIYTIILSHHAYADILSWLMDNQIVANTTDAQQYVLLIWNLKAPLGIIGPILGVLSCILTIISLILSCKDISHIYNRNRQKNITEFLFLLTYIIVAIIFILAKINIWDLANIVLGIIGDLSQILEITKAGIKYETSCNILLNKDCEETIDTLTILSCILSWIIVLLALLRDSVYLRK